MGFQIFQFPKIDFHLESISKLDWQIIKNILHTIL